MSSEPARGQRPNVIVFFTDQQRWDSTGVHGNPLDLTPNFDRLAAEGTHLYNAFTPQPVCGPARACLQTGLYATQTGCYTNGIPLPQDAFTLARAFGQAGYRTGYIGKWHLSRGEDEGPVPQEYRGGYMDWLAANMLEFTSDAYQTTLYDEEGRAVHLPGYRVDALTDAAIRYIDQHQSATFRSPQAAPFFLFLSFLEPHFQNHRDDYPAPTGYAERYTGRWTPPDLQALCGGTAYQHLPGYWGMVKDLMKRSVACSMRCAHSGYSKIPSSSLLPTTATTSRRAIVSTSGPVTTALCASLWRSAGRGLTAAGESRTWSRFSICRPPCSMPAGCPFPRAGWGARSCPSCTVKLWIGPRRFSSRSASRKLAGRCAPGAGSTLSWPWGTMGQKTWARRNTARNSYTICLPIRMN